MIQKNKDNISQNTLWKQWLAGTATIGLVVAGITSAAVGPVPTLTQVSSGDVIASSDINDLISSIQILDERTLQDCGAGEFLQGFDSGGVKICKNLGTELAALADPDGDGLDDSWEATHCAATGGDCDPNADLEPDGATNLQEFTAGTNPNLADTDGGGEEDGSELTAGRNPLVAGDDVVPPCSTSGLVKDANFGDGEHDFCYSTVVAADGTTWLNNLLGAEYNNIHSANFNPTQQAIAEDDYLAYGSLFQWGRPADGHELRTCTDSTNCTSTYGNTPTLSSNLTPNHNTFIKASSSPYDWTTTDSDGSQRTAFLAKSDGTGICPAGFRLPTKTELEATRVAENITNEASYLSSTFKGVISGIRHYGDGDFSGLGTIEYLWSSIASGTNSRDLYVYSSAQSWSTNYRAYGFSVRCRAN